MMVAMLWPHIERMKEMVQFWYVYQLNFKNQNHCWNESCFHGYTSYDIIQVQRHDGCHVMVSYRDNERNGSMLVCIPT